MGKPVPHVSVLLKNMVNRVVAFSNTDTAGRYRINISDTIDTTSFILEISQLQYHSVKQPLRSETSVYDFTLKQTVISLPEVRAKTKPLIARSGDTTSYQVSSFSREEDRSIGDIIPRLPGLTVDEKGMISFNGKSINDVYIGGDELMDGRYQVATKAISKNLIKSVQVIQNHQPVKVLQDRVRTDDVIINLVLQDENSIHLSGLTTLGAGLPSLGEVIVNAMLFNKKIKTLNVLKANNSGIDYVGDMVQFGAVSFLEAEGNTRPGPLLSPGTIGDPDIPRNNYFINRSGIANVNLLFNTAKHWQWKINLQGLADRNSLSYTGLVENYLQNDTIRYTESQDAIRKKQALSASLSLKANKEKFMFENTLRIITGGERSGSHMNLNGLDFRQSLQTRIRDLSNSFVWIPASKKKDIWGFSWYLNYYNSPQRLVISEGLNADVLNGGAPYSSILQSGAIPTLFSHASVSFRPARTRIAQTYAAGLMNERQDLNSTLQLEQLNGSFTRYKDDAGNALRWTRSRVYIKSSYEAEKGRLFAKLSVLLIAQAIRYDQPEYALKKSVTDLFINPSASVKVLVGTEDHIELNYNYSNNVGNISGVYRGAILTSYRSLQANDAVLQERNTFGSRLYYHFQRSVHMLFMNGEIRYDKVRANSIISSVITNHVQRSVLLPYENDRSGFSATIGASKYLFSVRATVSTQLVYRKDWYEQFVNDQRLPFLNNTLTVSAGADGKILKRVTISYHGNIMWSDSRLSSKAIGNNVLSSKAVRFAQRMTVGYSPVRLLFVNLKAWQMYNERPGMKDIQYVFLDANLRYKLAQWRTDLELDVSNIANIRKYEYFSVSSNRFAANTFNIRGRMLLLRATFNF